MEHTAIIKETADGSHTLYLPHLDETYHSIHGAKQESNYVFVNEGLNYFLSNNHNTKEEIRVFEVGFGTGLNAMLFAKEAKNKNIEIYFESIEKYPLEQDLISKLSYYQEEEAFFKLIHESEWNKLIPIHEQFKLIKIEADFIEFKFNKTSFFDIILMDAFAPDKQVEMWSLANFSKLIQALKPGGILITYSAKGDVKRALRESGFIVKRIQGPPGKMHMLRAQKPNNETI